MMLRASPNPTVFAVHALGLDRKAFEPLRQQLDGSRRFLAIELPGHGEAPSTPQPSLCSFVDAVLEQILDSRLAQTPSGPVHLVGHSFGGVVAALAASRLREEAQAVCSLSLLGTPAAGGQVFADRADAVVADGLAAYERSTFARWFGSEPPAEWSGAIRCASDALRRHSVESIATTWRALASFEGFSGLVCAPRVLCVAAEDDLSTPPAVMRQIVAALVSISHMPCEVGLTTIPSGGHLFPLTAAPSVATLLEAHWALAEAPRLPRESGQ